MTVWRLRSRNAERVPASGVADVSQGGAQK